MNARLPHRDWDMLVEMEVSRLVTESDQFDDCFNDLFGAVIAEGHAKGQTIYRALTSAAFESLLESPAGVEMVKGIFRQMAELARQCVQKEAEYQAREYIRSTQL